MNRSLARLRPGRPPKPVELDPDGFPYLGSYIRLLRTHQQVSRSDLADLVGCHPDSISNIETNKTNPSREMLVRIANALGAPVADLEARSRPPKPAAGADRSGPHDPPDSRLLSDRLRRLERKNADLERKLAALEAKSGDRPGSVQPSRLAPLFPSRDQRVAPFNQVFPKMAAPRQSLAGLVSEPVVGGEGKVPTPAELAVDNAGLRQQLEASRESGDERRIARDALGLGEALAQLASDHAQYMEALDCLDEAWRHAHAARDYAVCEEVERVRRLISSWYAANDRQQKAQRARTELAGPSPS